MRRTDREQSEAFARAVLAKCQYATLCTVNADGTPYGVPVSPVAVGDAVYFHCAPEGQKLDNIAHNPHVCLVCVGATRVVPEKYSTEYESAIVTGAATRVTDDAERRTSLYQLCEKYAPEHLAQFDAAIARSFHRTAVYKIAIRRITGKQKKYP